MASPAVVLLFGCSLFLGEAGPAVPSSRVQRLASPHVQGASEALPSATVGLAAHIASHRARSEHWAMGERRGALKCFTGSEFAIGGLEDCEGKDARCFIRYSATPDGVSVNRYCTTIESCPGLTAQGDGSFTEYATQADGSYVSKCCASNGCNGGVPAQFDDGLYWIRPADADDQFLTRGEDGKLSVGEFANDDTQKFGLQSLGASLEATYALLPPGTAASGAQAWSILEVAAGEFEVTKTNANGLPESIQGGQGAKFTLTRAPDWEVAWIGKKCPKSVKVAEVANVVQCQKACEDDPGCSDIIEWDTVNKECFKVTGKCGADETQSGGDGYFSFKSKCAFVTCHAASHCHAAGTCDATTGSCSTPFLTDGAKCDDDNALTVNDECKAGACVGEDNCAGVSCPAEGNCYEAGACDHLTGKCVPNLKAGGSSCDDGDDKTIDDMCNAGVCKGTDLCAAVICDKASTCHFSGVCEHKTGKCSLKAKRSGASCDDGRDLTIDDTCDDNAICQGVGRCDSVTCAAKGPCFAMGVCDVHTGECSHPFADDGTACDDSSDLTVDDVCDGKGVCVGKDLCKDVICEASNSCHLPGFCNHRTGQCSFDPKPSGETCDDGSQLTIDDTCDDTAICQGVGRCDSVTCAAKGPCFAVGVCSAETGECDKPFADEGLVCDDGNDFTMDDACDGKGVCAGKDLCKDAILDKPGSCHFSGACDHKTGLVSFQQRDAGATCDDGNQLTDSDTCDDHGVCTGKGRCEEVSCSAKGPCFATGVCDPQTGKCSNPFAAEGKSCDDGSVITVDDVCDAAGKCEGKDLCKDVTCEAPDTCHFLGVCDHLTGKCSVKPKHGGEACDDGDKLTIEDVCDSDAVCKGVGRCDNVKCAGQGACFVKGECDAETGKCSNPFAETSVACNDGSDITVDDVCDGKGACAGQDLCQDVTCEAPDTCHFPGLCDHKTGKCSVKPKHSGEACDDGDGITFDDVCDSSHACKGVDRCADVKCFAAGPCFAKGECDPETGKCGNPFAAKDATCDDMSSVTVDDVCDGAGVCAGTDRCAGVTCETGDHCKDPGTCDHATGSCFVLNKQDGVACDDGDDVTVSDVCTFGVCQGEKLCATVQCEALDVCHKVGECDHLTGACSHPVRDDDEACDDGNDFTVEDKCMAGRCIGKKSAGNQLVNSPGTQEVSFLAQRQGLRGRSIA